MNKLECFNCHCSEGHQHGKWGNVERYVECFDCGEWACQFCLSDNFYRPSEDSIQLCMTCDNLRWFNNQQKNKDATKLL